eukprot:1500890-Rhodomonas_salina.2
MLLQSGACPTPCRNQACHSLERGQASRWSCVRSDSDSDSEAESTGTEPEPRQSCGPRAWTRARVKQTLRLKSCQCQFKLQRTFTGPGKARRPHPETSRTTIRPHEAGKRVCHGASISHSPRRDLVLQCKRTWMQQRPRRAKWARNTPPTLLVHLKHRGRTFVSELHSTALEQRWNEKPEDKGGCYACRNAGRVVRIVVCPRELPRLIAPWPTASVSRTRV